MLTNFSYSLYRKGMKKWLDRLLNREKQPVETQELDAEPSTDAQAKTDIEKRIDTKMEEYNIAFHTGRVLSDAFVYHHNYGSATSLAPTIKYINEKYGDVGVAIATYMNAATPITTHDKVSYGDFDLLKEIRDSSRSELGLISGLFICTPSKSLLEISAHTKNIHSDITISYAVKETKLAYKKFFKRLSPTELNAIFQRIVTIGLYDAFDEIACDKENRFLIPRDIKSKWIKWRDQNKDMVNKLYPYAPEDAERIKPAVVAESIKVEDVPAPASPHSIAQKQAFFDNAEAKDLSHSYDVQHYLEKDKLKQIILKTYIEYNSGSIGTRISRAARYINTATTDTHLRVALFMGLIASSTERGIKEYMKSLGEFDSIEARNNHAKRLYESPFNHQPTRELLFNAAHRDGFLPELYFLLNAHDSYAPKDSTKHLIDWCIKNGIDLDNVLDAYTLPPIDNLDQLIIPREAEQTPAPQPEIEIQQEPEIIEAVEVEAEVEAAPETPTLSAIARIVVPDLLPDGQDVKPTLDLVDIFTDKQDPKPAAERKLEPRDIWFQEALEKDPNINHAACRIFINPLETTDQTGRYYKVFHVVTLDGNVTQYAISTCKGQVTYILKGDHGLMVDPETTKSLMDIPALRRERMVQTRRCHSKDGYQIALMELGYRDAANVTEQTKTATRWSGVSYRADQIFNSMVCFKNEMGYTPRRDSGIIVHGDIENDANGYPLSLAEAHTRWDLVDNAFRQGLIHGFENTRSLQAFWAYWNGPTTITSPRPKVN